MTTLEIYVDACVLQGRGVGIGVVCPARSSLNFAEQAPYHLVQYDPNLGELFAIIRGMERAEPYCSSLVVYTDSYNAKDVACGNWHKHYEHLRGRFQAVLSKYESVHVKLVSGNGDYYHNMADELARKGAENY